MVSWLRVPLVDDTVYRHDDPRAQGDLS